MDSLASRMKHARSLRSMNQTQLAKAAGVAQSTVGNIEAGLRDGANSLAAIAHALQVRYQWLRDGHEPMELPELYWPFEAVPLERFEALTERQKGAVERAMRKAMEEEENLQLASSTRKQSA